MSTHDAAAAAVVVIAIAATAMPVETSSTCYTDGSAYIGSKPDGLFIPEDLRIECAAVWCALAVIAAAVWWKPTIATVAATVIGWGFAAAGLNSIAAVSSCADDTAGAGFWCAHVAVAAAPWVIMTRES